MCNEIKLNIYDTTGEMYTFNRKIDIITAQEIRFEL